MLSLNIESKEIFHVISVKELQLKMKVEKDIQEIINFSYEFAIQMLMSHKEFHPFAAKIEKSGELVTIAYKGLETDLPKSKLVFVEFKTHLDDEFIGGKIKAYGITYNVYTETKEMNDKSDAVCIFVRHDDFEQIHRYYFPYHWNKKDQLIFRESFKRED